MVHHPVTEWCRGNRPPLRIMDLEKAVSGWSPCPVGQGLVQAQYLRLPPQPPRLYIGTLSLPKSSPVGSPQEIICGSDCLKGADCVIHGGNAAVAPSALHFG